MSLFPHPRLAYLFDAISDEILPQNELALRFAVSTRTIRTDILTLNNILHNYGAKIDYKRGIGYQLQIHDKQRFDKLPKQQKAKTIPRTHQERVLELLILFLTKTQPIKLDDIAERWFTSRTTLQSDLNQIRDFIQKYHLTFDIKPYHGIKLIGSEVNIRTCLTNLFWQKYINQDERALNHLQQKVLNVLDIIYLGKILFNRFERFDLRITAEGQHYLLYSCAVSIARITTGQELLDYKIDESDPVIKTATTEIAESLRYFLGAVMSSAECNYLYVQIASRCNMELNNFNTHIQQNSDALIEHILNYINDNYNYDLRYDQKLRNDLSLHTVPMLARIKYQVRSSNPLLNEIKQYYPFAYDITLSALINTQQYTEHKLSEDEIGYLTVHIGVALERNYGVEHRRNPQILLVSDSGNATLRMIEAKVHHDFPQIQINRILSSWEYEQLSGIDEDFIVTTVRLSDKNKPIIKIAPFPTPYQLEQLGRMAMADHSRPYLLEHFFDPKSFFILSKDINQHQLFKKVSLDLQKQGMVNSDFYQSLIERESIVSTLLGEGIAIPHSIGLTASKTRVTTVLAPKGIPWGENKDDIAYVIFVLAISKEEYEEAMAIYNLFVNFVKEKSTKRLLNSRSFADFQAIAIDSLGRLT